jgi:ribosomal protein S18 acetylase RimI-like enzyme
MLEARVLIVDDWVFLADIRTIALKDAPQAFLSTYDREWAYSESDWRAEFDRGEWTVAYRHGKAVGLLGATRDVATEPAGYYLEYMWVSPESRRCAVASSLLEAVLERLERRGVPAVWLWILNGNESARRFYEKHGFAFTGTRQPVTHSSASFEELMYRPLRHE